MIHKNDLLNYPDPQLYSNSQPVNLDDKQSYQDILDQMIEYVRLSQNESQEVNKKINKHTLIPAVGLSAIQIGVPLQMFYVLYHDHQNIKHEFAFINPKIVSHSALQTFISNEEGCLSVRGKKAEQFSGYVLRYFEISLTAYDYLQKKHVKVTAIGLPAVILQHELDHLHGILYIQKLVSLDTAIYYRAIPISNEISYGDIEKQILIGQW